MGKKTVSSASIAGKTVQLHENQRNHKAFYQQGEVDAESSWSTGRPSGWTELGPLGGIKGPEQWGEEGWRGALDASTSHVSRGGLHKSR